MEKDLLKFGKFLEVLLLFVAICLMVATPQAISPPGFLSIDCGSNVTDYEDPNTTLTWHNDDNYVRTGWKGALPFQVDKNLDNWEALRSFRYFPERRNKHCFMLSLSDRPTLVLIRAMFFHGGASELSQPIEFNVSINANIWFGIQFISSSADDLKKPIVQEGIFPYLRPTTYICLLPIRGTPFISSLEVRPLDLDGVMYNFTDRTHMYLSSLIRLNAGPPADAPTVRYPDDMYDRLWLNPATYDRLWLIPAKVVNCGLLGSNSSRPLQATSAEVNNVPLEVMADGWDGSRSGGQLLCDIQFPIGLDRKYAYVIFYFAPLDNVSSGQGTNISLNGAGMDSLFNVSQHSTVTAKAFDYVALPTSKALLELTTESQTLSYPILNAVEFYEEIIIDPTYTDDHSVNVTSFLKEIFHMEGWQGDPCVPVPYEWLGCSLTDPSDPYRLVIYSVALSNLSDGSSLLQLGNDSLWTLYNLTLTDCHINDSIAPYLLTQSDYLRVLDFSHNNITGLQWFFELYEDPYKSLDYLDLSYNMLTEEVPSFSTLRTAETMQHLNLSHNALNSLPGQWRNQSTNIFKFSLDSLVVLDLSHNNISGGIHLLDELMLMNNLSLQELHISDNDITGEFPSDVYFGSLKNLTFLNVSQNHIGGKLNLTLWHTKLQSTLSSANSTFIPANQIFSFLNNDITDIIPSLDELQDTIQPFLRQQDNLGAQNFNDSGVPRFNMGGVLLGGNPYCKNAKSRSQRYLCRFSLKDTVYDNPKQKSNKTLIIVASLTGAFMFLCGIIFIMIIWKLWRKVSVLQSIQQALADQKVQPPFYSYHDIKVATRDFHKDNILGKGGFGIVYKGVLSDGTAIAVKKLFHSNKQQVLNDFLNEVVLITGIKHKNLVQLTGCCIKERERILVYEYAERGNLAEALWGDKGTKDILGWRQRFNLCVNIARGLAYLHEELQPRIIHRDIKAPNILLDKNFNPKIADFGLARSILEEETRAEFTQFAGTRGYIAPEYATEGQLTAKADVFSFGILLLEIVSGRKCLDSSFPEDQIYIKSWVEKLQEEQRLFEVLQFELRDNFSKDEILKVIQIALICVQFNPKSRPTMSQVVTMFLGNVDFSHFLDVSVHKHRGFDEMYVLGENSDDNAVFSESTEAPLLSSSFTLSATSNRTPPRSISLVERATWSRII